MTFFAVFLRKLEPSCKIGTFSAAILGRLCTENGRRWCFLCNSILCVICVYHVYKEVWNPSIREAFVFIKHGGEINSDIKLPLLKLEVFPNFRDSQ